MNYGTRIHLSMTLRLLCVVLLVCAPSFFGNSVVAQCSGCTTTISGPDASSYTINPGEKICLTAGASFTGTVYINGGTLVNCASATQVFGLNFNFSGTQGRVENHGTIVLTVSNDLRYVTVDNYGDLSITASRSLAEDVIFTNYGLFAVSGNLTLLNSNALLDNHGHVGVTNTFVTHSGSTLNNFRTGTINCEDFTAQHDWYNQGVINVGDDFSSQNGAVAIIDGGCINVAGVFQNFATIIGTLCGTITADGITTNTGILNGNLAIVDLSPPPAAPFIDNQFGTVGPEVQWTSCGCPGSTPEDCSNGLDDDGDGYVDDQDPDCIGDVGCACPPGSTVITNIPFGYTVPVGESHCLDADEVLNTAWNNFTVQGNLYITAGNSLEILSGLMHPGPQANIIICDGASFTYLASNASFDNTIYNFGWAELCVGDLITTNFVLGENSLTSLKGDDVLINGTLEYNGVDGGSTYMHIAPTNTLNSSTGSVTLNGSAEIVVEVDHASIVPNGVTDCNGCPELSGATATCNDGSILTTYLALQSNSEICDNGLDDDGDGLIDCLDPDCNANTNCPDNDGDLINDAIDIDDDNDGILDTDERCSENINTTVYAAQVIANSGDPTVTPQFGDPAQALGAPDWDGDLVDNPEQFVSVGLNGASLVLGWGTDIYMTNSGDANDEIQIFEVGVVESSLLSLRPIASTKALLDNQGLLTPDLQGFYPIGMVGASNVSFDVDAATASTFSQGELVFDQLKITSNETTSITTPGTAGPDIDAVEVYYSISCPNRDSDSDGILDYFDLDSDNDGIYDLLEAGHIATDANNDGVVDGIPLDFGANGFLNGLESSVDSGTPNYVVRDTDADGRIDCIERDADADGCFDVLEAGFTDPEFDGVLGAIITSVNGDGLVTSGSDGYTGTSPFVTNASIQSGCADNDNDNISDINDRDDDNDGILDTDEWNCSSAIPSWETSVTNGTLSADFTSTGGVSGTVISTSPTSGFFNPGRPTYTTVATGIRANRGGGSGATTVWRFDQPTAISEFIVLGIKTTSGDETQIFKAYGQNGQMIPFTFTATNGGAISGDTLLGGPTTNSALQSDFTFNFLELVDSISVRSIGSVDFVFMQLSNACLGDFDADEVPDYLDLDSDNDGIYDVWEAGHGQAQSSGAINGGVDSFGIPLNVSNGSGGINYLYTNSDGSANIDAYSLDSDADGCFDVIEAGYTDANLDGILGSFPLTVNPLTGLVTSGGP